MRRLNKRHWRQTVEVLAAQTYLNGDPLPLATLATVLGSLQPVRRTTAGQPPIEGSVQQAAPTHRLWIAYCVHALTANAFRVDGVTYYATRAPSNTGGQGHHLEIELSQTRPIGAT